jgi:hypothetical protein
VGCMCAVCVGIWLEVIFKFGFRLGVQCDYTNMKLH